MTEKESFFIEYLYNNEMVLAEIKPCCGEDNSYYYDVVIKNAYQFTVTPNYNDETGMVWKISLKNSDKYVNPELIDIIGEEIDKHLFTDT